MRRQYDRAVCALRFFFFNDTATTEIYTLSLHDALPISARSRPRPPPSRRCSSAASSSSSSPRPIRDRKSTRLNSSHLVISYADFCLIKQTAVREADVPVARPHHGMIGFVRSPFL